MSEITHLNYHQEFHMKTSLQIHMDFRLPGFQ